MGSLTAANGTIINMHLGSGELMVVETDDDLFLGTVEVRGDALVIRDGFVGRPTLVDVNDVVGLTLAYEHPDVTEVP